MASKFDANLTEMWPKEIWKAKTSTFTPSECPRLKT